MRRNNGHQYFVYPHRDSQSLCNDRCQTILYKAVFEHFPKIANVAALVVTSTSFQNSSLGANFLHNFTLDNRTIRLFETVLTPSSCFSLQFVPSLKIVYLSEEQTEKVGLHPGPNFALELAKTKYLHLQLRTLALNRAADSLLLAFFESVPAWPQLRTLSLETSRVQDETVALICQAAPHLSDLNLLWNTTISDLSLLHISKLPALTHLNIGCCTAITDAGLEHVSKCSNLVNLDMGWIHESTDVGVEKICCLSNLTRLNLNCEKISDVSLERIAASLPNIRMLNLCSYGATTKKGKGEFVKALPTCEVVLQ